MPTLGRIANVLYVALKLSLFVVTVRSWNHRKSDEKLSSTPLRTRKPAPIVTPVRLLSGRNGETSKSGCGVWS